MRETSCFTSTFIYQERSVSPCPPSEGSDLGGHNSNNPATMILNVLVPHCFLIWLMELSNPIINTMF